MKHPDDVRKRALTFYSRNHRTWLSGEFTPLSISLQPPTAAEVAADNGASVRLWLAAWEAHWLTPKTATKRLDVYGTHTIPASVVLDSPETAARLAGMLPEWERINTLLDRFVTALGASSRPALIARLATWKEFDDTTAAQFIDTVTWINNHDTSMHYIRELPIKGIDSKWLEKRRSLIEALTGPLEFKSPPALVDMRSLDPSLSLFGLLRVVCELEDARATDLPGSRVIIVENFQSYLALPDMPHTVAVYGQGLNAISLTNNAVNLVTKDVLYWGDLDSNGFYILDRVRRNLPHTRSVLMDIETCRSHADFGVEETTSKRFDPETLTPDELAPLEFLHSNADNTWLRIEQERIGFDWVEEKLRKV
ncbi:Wadjet anti-phage system protein JetD domain-containing protein [Corynebacterium pilosum]|uniref:Uncharacterized protein conserved in bacteria n=1 Tax=Corynebacterium pilosum TaxID=35756 RepID=A0A376CMM9_9CORY|nr:Wadjet anti-phage system protein JetD domain-containing protein [Corynebacterium pilosum]STC69776.1 Uncharacterized protein conserved in bacteria [Corynebacterium pilosum]